MEKAISEQKKRINMMKEALERAYDKVVFVDTDQEEGMIITPTGTTKKVLFDVWRKEFLKENYVGDDIKKFFTKTCYEALVRKLLYKKEYTIEYSFKDKGLIRRKQLKAFMMLQDSVMCVCFSDVTSRYMRLLNAEKMRQESLEIAHDMMMEKENYINGIKNELRDPVCSANELLKQAMETEEGQAKAYIKKAQASLAQYLDMLGSFFEQAAVENGKLECKKEAVIVEYLMTKCEKLLISRAQECEVELSFENLESRVEAFTGDFELICRIMFYMVGILLDESKEGDKIKGVVDFEIDDVTGDTDDIFDFVFTAMLCSAHESLGKEQLMEKHARVLRLSNYIADRMDGILQLMVDEDGLELQLRIPVQKADRREIMERDMLMHMVDEFEEDDFSDCHALVVDDDKLRAEMTAAKLRHFGLKVDMAGDGQEAIDKLLASEKNYYQIMFMNPILPNKTGLEATMEIREFERHDLDDITIVALTSNEMRDERIRSLEHGMDYHIVLPLNDMELKGILLREIRNIDTGEDYGKLGFRVVK